MESPRCILPSDATHALAAVHVSEFVANCLLVDTMWWQIFGCGEGKRNSISGHRYLALIQEGADFTFWNRRPNVVPNNRDRTWVWVDFV